MSEDRAALYEQLRSLARRTSSIASGREGSAERQTVSVYGGRSTVLSSVVPSLALHQLMASLPTICPQNRTAHHLAQLSADLQALPPNAGALCQRGYPTSCLLCALFAALSCFRRYTIPNLHVGPSNRPFQAMRAAASFCTTSSFPALRPSARYAPGPGDSMQRFPVNEC